MKKVTVWLIATIMLAFPALSVLANDDNNNEDGDDVAERIKGRIILQVEGQGEAWYVNPTDAKRYYLGKPDDAFSAMRNQSLGITNEDLEKIPTYRSDTDGDDALIERLKGKILLQVENNGEAWYISPVNKKKYYLGRPADAFLLMQNLGLGISNDDLNKVESSSDSSSKTVNTGDANVELTATAENDGIHLNWTKSNRGENFEHYKLVRSKTNSGLTYSRNGYIKAYSDISALTYTDEEDDDSNQAYYYRVCVLYSTSASAIANSTNDGSSSLQEECSNVIQITPVTTKSKDDNSKDDNDDTSKKDDNSKDDNDDTSKKDDNSKDDNDDDLNQMPVLEAGVEDGGVELNWSENTENSFSYYKVVRSQTDSTPTYPEDGYIAVQNQDDTSYFDTEVTRESKGTYYYRVCSVSSGENVTCGNVETVVDGKVLE